MKIMGVRELQEQTAEVLRQVREEGQSRDIRYGGEIVARLVPVPSAAEADQDDAAVWADLERLATEISARWPAEVSAVEAVRDVRGGV